MKKILITLALSLTVLVAGAQEFAKMDKSVMDASYYPANAAKRKFAKTDADKKALEPQIRVVYSRPSLNNRDIFKDIIKYGETWRIGANESTEILFLRDVEIGGKKLNAGRYTLVVTPTENDWTLHVNSENDGWGNFSHDKTKDVTTVSAKVSKDNPAQENVSIALYSPSENLVHLKLGWGTYVAEWPIKLL